MTRENLKNEIAALEEELASAEKKFNDRVNKSQIVSSMFNQSMDSLLCLGSTPCESAQRFYGIYSGLFDFAESFKASHPEEGKAVVNANLIQFCIEDEAIKAYLTNHLYIASPENIAFFARSVVDVHNTLVSLGFSDVITTKKLLEDKKEYLALLEEGIPDVMLPPFDVFDEQLERLGEATKMIEDATRSLVNKGARKLIKIAKYVKDKTDKK